ncbi:oxidoreductase [Methylophaga sp. 42_25_T18]|nr:oxidoreductase [Methylophaga sp. 42_25_T18]
MFKALVLQQDDHQTVAQLQQIDEASLPNENIEVAVEYSSLNYKDGLAITGKGRVVRSFPMVPGIDFSGTVTVSSDKRFKTGDKVVLTGHGVGEKHWGGMAEKAKVSADWLVPLVDGLDTKQAMKIGTAGLTSMLSIMALEEAGLKPEQGEVLVTGASGGVGSVAITLLHALGYDVVALTGRIENSRSLETLGASRVISRDEMLLDNKPLDKQLWAGVIDTVGSHILAKALSQTQYGGAIAACGMAAGIDLPTTVMPFILRGVTLVGIDSVYCPYARRIQAWQRLAKLLPESFFEQACEQITLDQVPDYAEKILQGQVKGRLVINI